MQDRHFVVSFNVDKPVDSGLGELIEKNFTSLGYKLVALNEEELVFEKGSKIFTYVGLVNWNYLFRRVSVTTSGNAKGKIFFTYSFSWLTNIGVLIKHAMPEIKILQDKFAAKTFKVERFR
jgi:formate/nitrite transporter FocA (FNT family)